MTPSPHNLLDACAETVLAVDPDTLSILSANHAAGTLLGLPVNDLIGCPISDFEVGLQDLYFWEEVRTGNRQNYTSVEGEYRHHSGGLLSVRKSMRLINEEGRNYYVVSVHDITAQRQIEEQTALSNSLLLATLESTVDGILVADLGRRVQHYNRRFLEQWKLPDALKTSELNQLIFQQILLHLTDPEPCRDWIEILFNDPIKEAKTECHLLDGRIFEVSSRPQRYKDRPIGRVFSFHDISSLKEAERLLIAARDAAQAASRAKSEFLSHMSHELRTPLNAILGFSQVLEDELAPPNKALIQHVSKAGQHLLGLINELLDLASIEAGKLRLSLDQIDLAEVIDDALHMMQPLAASHGIDLQATPIAHGRYLVKADLRRLRQMLLNLLSNAIKYNRERGKVEITVLSCRPEYWRLVVSDTGVGITEEEQKQLFEPFTRVGDLQAQVEGTGIGLAFTRKLVHLMHGQVGFKSKLGIGSSFWLELPCSSGTTESPTVASPTYQSDAGITVLYVEDDLLSQKLFTTILTRKRPELRLLLACNGMEGLTLARKELPELILLDQQLPDMPGAEVLAALLADPNTCAIPVFALSGNAAQHDIDAALAAGFSRYLTKPLQIDEVLAAMDSVLNHHGDAKPN